MKDLQNIIKLRNKLRIELKAADDFIRLYYRLKKCKNDHPLNHPILMRPASDTDVGDIDGIDL